MTRFQTVYVAVASTVWAATQAVARWRTSRERDEYGESKADDGFHADLEHLKAWTGGKP